MIDRLSNKYKIILLTKNIYVDYYKNHLDKKIDIIGYDWQKFEKQRKNLLDVQKMTHCSPMLVIVSGAEILSLSSWHRDT